MSKARSFVRTACLLALPIVGISGSFGAQTPAAHAAARATAQAAALLDDTFDGQKLDETVWAKGGTAGPLHNIRDGTLRLVSMAMMEQAFVTTKRADYNFFKQPVTVVWDLNADKTLAGPYAATQFSKAYAGLRIGGTTHPKRDNKGAAELGLTAWPGEAADKGLDAPWFYTLNLGRLMPNDPKKNYGPKWLDDWKLSGVPQRIVWTLGPTDWSVEIEGARFVHGDPQKRAGKHELKEADFAQSGFHLMIFSSAHVSSMEPGTKNFLGAAVYTDRIAVTTPAAVPPYKEAPRAARPTTEDVLKSLLGKEYAETAPPSKPQLMFGVNYAGGEFRPKEGFVPPTAQSLDYWKSKGVLLMRLPITWERLQPKVNAPLDEKYLDGVKKSVRLMDERGMKVLLDLHNYDRYEKQLVGTESVPYAAFGDLWKRLAETFKDDRAIWGYGIMNEPFGTKGTWPKAAQAGIDGVRSVDAKTMIVIGGDNFSGAENWAKNGAELPKQLRDPSNNLCWEAHCYFDDGSGKYNHTYEYELNKPNSQTDPMLGVRRLEPFVQWLKANNYKGIVGEFSVPANVDRDPRWLVILDNVYEYLRKNEVPSTYWSAGTLWTPGRSYVIEPNWREGPNKGKDRPQTQILLKHARAYAGPPPGSASPVPRY